jgi:hypothetical protein
VADEVKPEDVKVIADDSHEFNDLGQRITPSAKRSWLMPFDPVPTSEPVEKTDG